MVRATQLTKKVYTALKDWRKGQPSNYAEKTEALRTLADSLKAQCPGGALSVERILAYLKGQEGATQKKAPKKQKRSFSGQASVPVPGPATIFFILNFFFTGSHYNNTGLPLAGRATRIERQDPEVSANVRPAREPRP